MQVQQALSWTCCISLGEEDGSYLMDTDKKREARWHYDGDPGQPGGAESRGAESKQRTGGPCLSMWSDWLDSLLFEILLGGGAAAVLARFP